MADNPSEFTKVEKKRMEAYNKDFATRAAMRQKQLQQMKRRNVAIFACLVASVAGIYGYTLFATRQEKLDFDE